MLKFLLPMRIQRLYTNIQELEYQNSIEKCINGKYQKVPINMIKSLSEVNAFANFVDKSSINSEKLQRGLSPR